MVLLESRGERTQSHDTYNRLTFQDQEVWIQAKTNGSVDKVAMGAMGAMGVQGF